MLAGGELLPRGLDAARDVFLRHRTGSFAQPQLLQFEMLDALHSGEFQCLARAIDGTTVDDEHTPGFFGDSLQRRLVDLDYYISLGGYAYSRLASHDDAFADVFGELAEKFVPVVDVLSDISDRSRSTNRDVLRLYERWVRTGSARDRALLVEKGLTAPGSRLIQ